MARNDRHLVVDGSNIATEGRTLPSLKQLDEAVRAITTDFPYSSLTVIVDATFAHRIDESERPEFEAAVLAGEIVTPPAGAVGRGDAFILQVADKAKAVVLSNDSFQEFHGEHEWLFEEGRLIGGKPIEGIGWVFVERVPVRGPASRRAIRVASEGGRVSSRGGRSRSRTRSSSSSSSSSASSAAASVAASGPAPVPGPANPPPRKRAEVTTPLGSVARRGRGRNAEPAVEPDTEPDAAVAADITAAPAAKTSKRFEELNDPRSFMSFVSRYSIGDEVEAVVDQFSSHGCYLRAASARCYLPCRAMGDPPPTRARDIVAQGQSIIVKVESLDADRRGINVALVRAVPVDGESKESKQPRDPQPAASRVRNPAKPPQPPIGSTDDAAGADATEDEGTLTRSTTNVATTKPAKKTAAKKSTATGAKKAAKATPSARATKAAAKKTTAKKAVAKKATAKKATTTKKAVKKAVAKKTTATAKKAPAKKAPAKKAAAKKA